MDSPAWDDDQRLLSDLGDAIASVRDLAEVVAQRARALLAWRTVDDDLAQASLTFDSDLVQAAADRSTADTARTLVFESAPVALELEISTQGVFGQVVPPACARVEIQAERAEGIAITTTSDDLGFFMLAELPAGRVRIRLQTSFGRLMTGWFPSS